MLRIIQRALALTIILMLATACESKPPPEKASAASAKPKEEKPVAAPAATPKAKPRAKEASEPEPAPAEPEPPAKKLEPLKVNSPRGVDLVPREKWAEMEPMLNLLEGMKHPENAPITYLVVMQSGFPTSPDTELQALRNIQTGHMKRGWGDVSAHYFIGPSGKVYEGRPLQYRSDGSVGSGMGNNSFVWGKCAIMMLGDFRADEEALTDEAREALETLIEDRMAAFNELFKEDLQAQQEDLKTKLSPGADLTGLDQVRLRIHPAAASTPIQIFLEEGRSGSIRSTGNSDFRTTSG